MTKADYLYIQGDLGKIDLDGDLLPSRHSASPEKTGICGRDICFLMEAAKRCEAVGKSEIAKENFSRIISAEQAQRALSGIANLFQGSGLVNMPESDTFWKVENDDAHFGLDWAANDIAEPLEPWPEVDGEVVASPFLSAFGNLKKLEGHWGGVRDAEFLPCGFSILWSQNQSASKPSETTRTTSICSAGFRYPISYESQGNNPYGVTYAYGPHSPTPEVWLPDGAKEHVFPGKRIINLTKYQVLKQNYLYSVTEEDLKNFSSGTTITADEAIGYVVRARSYISPGQIYKYYENFADYKTLLQGCCNALGWDYAELTKTGEDTGNGIRYLRNLVANAQSTFWAATMDDCIARAF